MQPVESRPRPSRRPNRRSALLAVLRAADHPLRIDEVSAAVGIAESTAQFHLSLLVSAGLASRTPTRTGVAGRPSWRYTAAPEAATASVDSYQDLALALAAQLGGGARAAVVARDAGRRWADTIPPGVVEMAATPAQAVAALATALDGLGFAPETAADGREIVLHACPFEAVARQQRAVVCGVHLGLVERTAAVIGGGICVTGLEPFRSEQPLACAVRLGSTA